MSLKDSFDMSMQELKETNIEIKEIEETIKQIEKIKNKSSQDIEDLKYKRGELKQLRDELKQLRDQLKQIRKAKLIKLKTGRNYSNENAILELLHEQGWMPDKISPPVYLVDLGGAPRSECMLVNRESAISNLQAISALRLEKRIESDKESHPHIICMSAPGTGKSRLADYGLVALKDADKIKYPSLASLANNDASLAVHISYNANTPFDENDMKNGSSFSLAIRMLESYFRNVKFNAITHSQLCGIKNIRSLTMEACVSAILTDHRRRLDLPANADLLLYVAVDDVTSICSNRDRGWTHKKGKAFLKSVFDNLARLYSGVSFFFVAMVTGTVLGPTNELLVNRRYINLSVPLLSLEQSMELAQDAFARAEISDEARNHFNWSDFKLLLCDIGGIPRYVWEAINNVLRAKLHLVNLQALRSWIKQEIVSRHQVLMNELNSTIFLSILSAVVLRDPVVPMSNVMIEDSTSWADLENSGLIYFAPLRDLSNVPKVNVVLPLLNFESMVEKYFPFALTLSNSLCMNEWKSWERFVAYHDALLMTLFRLQRRETVSVSEYYRGAYVGSALKDSVITFPIMKNKSDIKDAVVSVQTLPHRFPESDKSLEVPLETNTVYLNAEGAKMDVVVRHKLANPGGNLIRGIHCKHTTRKDTLDLSVLVESRAITASNLMPYASKAYPAVSYLHVHVSNREAKVPVGDVSDPGWPDDAVIVTRDQLEAFFSRTFADRIRLMLPTVKSHSPAPVGSSHSKSYSTHPSVKAGGVDASGISSGSRHEPTDRRLYTTIARDTAANVEIPVGKLPIPIRVHTHDYTTSRISALSSEKPSHRGISLRQVIVKMRSLVRVLHCRL